MEISLLLMQQIAQLFIVLLMGYVVVKAGLLKAPFLLYLYLHFLQFP